MCHVGGVIRYFGVVVNTPRKLHFAGPTNRDYPTVVDPSTDLGLAPPGLVLADGPYPGLLRVAFHAHLMRYVLGVRVGWQPQLHQSSWTSQRDRPHPRSNLKACFLLRPLAYSRGVVQERLWKPLLCVRLNYLHFPWRKKSACLCRSEVASRLLSPRHSHAS